MSLFFSVLVVILCVGTGVTICLILARLCKLIVIPWLDTFGPVTAGAVIFILGLISEAIITAE